MVGNLNLRTVTLRKNPRMWKIYTVIVVLFIITCAALYGVFRVNGLPISQQALAYDAIRVRNFQSLTTLVQYYYQDHNQLPAHLKDISSDPQTVFSDPQTKKDYTYKPLNANNYELCTTFSANSKDMTRSNTIREIYISPTDMFVYKKGYSCVKFNVPSSLRYVDTPLYYPDKTVIYPTPTVTHINKIRYPVKGLIVCAENNLNVEWFSTGKGDHHVEVGLVTPEGKSYTLGTVNTPHAGDAEMLDQYTWNVPSTVSAHGLSMETGYYVTVSDTLGGKVSNTNGESFEIRKCVGN